MNSHADTYDARATLETAAGPVDYYRLGALEEAGIVNLAKMPYSIRVLLENVLRHTADGIASDEDVRRVASWTQEAHAAQRCTICTAPRAPVLTARKRACEVVREPRYAGHT